MDLIEILTGFMGDPITYSIIFFIYVILAAIILPIPVEIGLFNPYISPILLILILGFGKGVGSFIAFEIGTRLRGGLKKSSYKIPILTNRSHQFTIFVRKRRKKEREGKDGETDLQRSWTRKPPRGPLRISICLKRPARSKKATSSFPGRTSVWR